MAELKISQLPISGTATPTDYFMIVQNGVNKRLTLTTLLKNLDSSDNLRINPSRNAVNFSVSSRNITSLFVVNGVSDFVGVNTDLPEERFHVNGNLKVGSSSKDGVMIDSTEEVIFTLANDDPLGAGYFKPLNSARIESILTVENGISVGRFVLNNGTVGQTKTLVLKAVQTNLKATVKVDGGVGFNRVDLTAVGQSVMFKCVSVGGVPKWVCVGSYNANLYTVV